MTPSPPPERRRAARVDLTAWVSVDATATCISSGKLLSGRLVNLSADGCSLALGPGQQPELGIRCAVRFELAGTHHFDLLATVMRLTQAGATTALGLRFDSVEINHVSRQRLADLIARLGDTPPPEER